MIFQPVWFALYISLMMLVLVILSSVFQRPTVQHTAPSEMPFRLNQSPDRTSSTLEVADMLSVSLKTAQFTIGDALLSAIALVLMWKLVKLASSGSQIAWVDKATSGITSAVEQTVAYTPVIPTSRGAVGLAAVYNPVTGRSEFVDKMSENIHSKINRYKSDQEGSVKQRLGIKSAGLTSSEEFNLTTLISKILVETSGFKTFNAFTTELKNILQGKQIKVSQLASYIHGAFQKAGAEQRTTSRNPFGWTNTAFLKTVHDFTKNADVQEAWKKLSREHYSALIGAMTGFTPKYTSYESGKDELIGAPNK